MNRSHLYGDLEIFEKEVSELIIPTSIIRWQLETDDFQFITSINYKDNTLKLDLYFDNVEIDVNIEVDDIVGGGLIMIPIPLNSTNFGSLKPETDLSKLGQLIDGINTELGEKKCVSILQLLNLINKEIGKYNDVDIITKKPEPEPESTGITVTTYSHDEDFAHVDMSSFTHDMFQDDSDDDFSIFKTDEENASLKEMAQEKRWKRKANKFISEQKVEARPSGLLTPHSVIQLIISELKRINKEKNDIRITPIKDNIYSWRVKLSNFDCDSDIGKDPREYALLKVEIDPFLYPHYPPMVCIICPEMENGLEYSIANMDYLSIDGWNPTNGLETTIKSVKNIIQEFGIVCPCPHDEEDKDLIDLKNSLIKLSMVSEISPAKEIQIINIPYNSHQSCIKEYINSEKQKRKRIVTALTEVNYYLENYISDIDKMNNIMFDRLVKESCLIPFLVSSLDNKSLSEIIVEEAYYTEIFQIISKMHKEHIYVFDKLFDDHKPIYDIIKDIHQQALSALDHKKTDDDYEMMQFVEGMIRFYANIEEKFTDYRKIVETDLIDPPDPEDITETYETDMKLDLLDQSHFSEDSDYTYKRVYSVPNKESTLRISKEISLLPESLPLSPSSSIFVRVDRDPFKMKCLITGPRDTPYSSGCFAFDIYIPATYPVEPPKIKFKTGDGSIEFSPYLFKSGDMFLPMLDTWNPESSNLLQVLKSIQSTIFVKEPYYSYIEDTYEKTPARDAYSSDYNLERRYHTIKWAIIDQLKHPSYGFRGTILKHFSHKRDEILQTVIRWIKEVPASQKSRFIELFNELDEELRKFVLLPSS